MKSRLLRTLTLCAAGTVATVHAQTQAQPAKDEIVQMEAFNVTDMKTFSDQAIPGKTPVAFTELGKEVITAELGSRDIPLVLNTAPSVYATTDSGGAGDARVNVRGFNQRNVSILINGVPTNDIENGWLYWSNWDGLGDVTTAIQLQRGMSNVTLPTPSIGGTMNIITDPAAARLGGSLKLEYGSNDFMKATGVFNTGLLKDKVAVTVGGVVKQGDGYVNGTYTKGLGYYLGALWKINKQHRLELFAIGAPQRHGQRSFASNIAAYDVEYARELGYTDADIAAAANLGPINAGLEFNPNYAPVSATYTGKQYYWDGTHSRENASFLNERENYFHKPQANLNWYFNINDRLKLASVFYYSGGRGGGAGTLGSVLRYAKGSPYSGNVDWDATIARNASAAQNGNSRGILRNSVNNQDQFGAVSKLTFTLSDEIKLSGGVDWRTAKIDHFREVRDLLGGQYFLPTAAQASEFWAAGTNTRLGLGDHVDYDNTNTVDWYATFLQGQYEKGPITAFAVYGYSLIEYSYEDNFRRAAPGSDQKFRLESGLIDGHQVKGGVQYAINKNLSVFTNAGWVSKVPVFDGAINDAVGIKVRNPTNEKFSSVEAGIRFVSTDRKFNVSANYYYTLWRDRTVSTYDERADTITYLRGVDSNYAGVEVEGAYQPNKWIRFDVAASLANWYYVSDVKAEKFRISSGQFVSEGSIAIQSLKIGDAPQTQIAAAATVFPVKGLSVKLQGRQYHRYWADYTADTRTDMQDRGQSWKIPNYSLFDLHVNYRVPSFSEKIDISVFAHVFNLMNTVYISDATDNSQYESISTAPSHSAQRAEVYFGQPRSVNVGVKVSF